MQNSFTRVALLALNFLFLAVSGCRGEIVWPIGEGAIQEYQAKQSDASEYRCAGNKHFSLRYLDNGAATWIVLPEREFRLDKEISVFGNHYSNGKITLVVNGNVAAIEDEAGFTFNDCKVKESS